MEKKLILLFISLTLQLGAFITFVVIDWRIGLAVFAWTWGNNITNNN